MTRLSLPLPRHQGVFIFFALNKNEPCTSHLLMIMTFVIIVDPIVKCYLKSHYKTTKCSDNLLQKSCTLYAHLYTLKFSQRLPRGGSQECASVVGWTVTCKISREVFSVYSPSAKYHFCSCCWVGNVDLSVLIKHEP